MIKYNKVLILASAALLVTAGCSVTTPLGNCKQDLPSVKVGKGVNHDKLLDLRLLNGGTLVGVTVPLVSVDIPSPSTSVDKN